MLSDEQVIQTMQESRQHDIAAMLLAIVLIERGQTDEAKRVLIDRLPEHVAAPLRAKP
jgi:hypothetical protein